MAVLKILENAGKEGLMLDFGARGLHHHTSNFVDDSFGLLG
jgi:hypothetical protein